MTPACEERGADLFLLARDGGSPGGDLRTHLASCPACAAEAERLRGLVRALPAATGGLAPRPSTRVAVLGAARGPAPPLPPPRRIPTLPSFWLPVGVLAASLLATVWVLGRSDGPAVPGGEGIAVRTLFGEGAVQGLGSGALAAGSEVSAARTAALRLGAPLDAEVVLGEGTRLRLPPSHRFDRSADLLAGAAYFEPAPAAGGPPLRVRAGGLEVASRGTPFTLEVRASGVVALTLGSGTAVVRSGDRETTLAGPCRLDAAAGSPLPPPVPAEAGDATGWFAHPVLSLEVVPRAGGEPPELLLTLRPSVPRTLRIAPWNRFDPAFFLRIHHETLGLSEVPVNASLLARPSPEADGTGAFLLGPGRPYRVHVDAGNLGLGPGRYRVEAYYAASRPGGLWRGTRASNGVDLDL